MTEKPARSFHRLGESLESGSKSRHRWLRGLLVALVWLLIWQIAGWLIHNDLLLASPGQVFLSLCGLAVTPVFWQSAFLSLIRIQAGYLLGVLTGAALAVLTERVTWLHRFFSPAISAIRSTPVASFIILALVWMSSSRVVVFIVFLMVMPIVWVNVVEGIRKTDRQLLEMAYVFHLKPRQILRLIYLPSVAPFFIAAATTGLGLGWKAGIAAEVLSRPPFSLGGRLYDAKIYLETADLLAYTGIVILISLLLEHLLLQAFRLAGRYFQHHGRRNILKDKSL